MRTTVAHISVRKCFEMFGVVLWVLVPLLLGACTADTKQQLAAALEKSQRDQARIVNLESEVKQLSGKATQLSDKGAQLAAEVKQLSETVALLTAENQQQTPPPENPISYQPRPKIGFWP